MEFDDIYNVNCSLRLASGRKITLNKLTQSRTYAGLLEGTPAKWSNDKAIQRALDDAHRDSWSKGEPLLIPPERRDYQQRPGDMQPVLDRQTARDIKHVPEWLPEVECVGIFDSISPARDENMDASSLTIAWYQDNFGINPQAVERLRLVDRERYAHDWQY